MEFRNNIQRVDRNNFNPMIEISDGSIKIIEGVINPVFDIATNTIVSLINNISVLYATYQNSTLKMKNSKRLNEGIEVLFKEVIKLATNIEEPITLKNIRDLQFRVKLLKLLDLNNNILCKIDDNLELLISTIPVISTIPEKNIRFIIISDSNDTIKKIHRFIITPNNK